MWTKSACVVLALTIAPIMAAADITASAGSAEASIRIASITQVTVTGPAAAAATGPSPHTRDCPPAGHSSSPTTTGSSSHRLGGTVCVLRPPGQDPATVLRAARLVLPEDSYEELAGHLGVPASWPIRLRC